MHLLAAEAGRIDDGDAAVDLDQLPGDIVFLSSADSELSALGQAASQSSLDISLRLANLGMLSHPLSVDLYIEKNAFKIEADRCSYDGRRGLLALWARPASRGCPKWRADTGCRSWRGSLGFGSGAFHNERA